MDIAAVDRWAVTGQSYLHRATAAGKLIAAGLVIAAVLVTRDLVALLGIYLLLVAAVAATGLPTWRVLGLASYPALFAVLFAASSWDGTLYRPAMIILKAVAAGLAVVSVIVTTPYPRLFSVFRRVLPELVAEGLFLTYRSLFLLLGLLDDLFTALRLRGGLSRRRYLGNARSLAWGLGMLLLRALALSERLHDVLHLRGYRGRLAAEEGWRLSRQDLPSLASACAMFFAALALRYQPPPVAYHGYVLVVPVLALLAAVLWRRRVTFAERTQASGAGR